MTPIDPAQSLRFAGHLVAPGETAELKLKVVESYTGEPLPVPVTVVRGAAGPTLFVTATVHGDELNGVGVLRALLNDTDWSALRGTLIAVPVANVPGFLAQDRRMPDRRDLNRSFPGNRRGSLTARLAQVLFREVVLKSDFGIDLHTAGRERTNYPHVRADLSQPPVAALAHSFGCPVMVDSRGPERSLRRAAVQAGVPTIVYEAGSPLRFERPLIEIGVAGVLNVLSSLGMLAGSPAGPPLAMIVERTQWVRSRAGGILDSRVELGQPLRRGGEVGLLTNPFGRDRSLLKAPCGGLVLGLTQVPLVHPGDPVCHLARLDARALDVWEEHWLSGTGKIRL